MRNGARKIGFSSRALRSGPLSEESAKAEDQFYSELARLFDDLPEPEPALKAFQKKIIQACRAKLIHGDKPTGI